MVIPDILTLGLKKNMTKNVLSGIKLFFTFLVILILILKLKKCLYHKIYKKEIVF